METSPREEGDDGHNSQLGTKAVATMRTVGVNDSKGNNDGGKRNDNRDKKDNCNNGNDSNDSNYDAKW